MHAGSDAAAGTPAILNVPMGVKQPVSAAVENAPSGAFCFSDPYSADFYKKTILIQYIDNTHNYIVQ
ncbi:hypothetical protein [Massilia sp.]|uniref:hypothetical protein n=1 Tax=Massilia sp. TaxID=1882437 RepID=UPI0028A5CEDF|nr:hypothetical protein [Massilia sp.]